MNSSGAIIADIGARERALDPAKSFIVQAPAGSGKTTLLVERYLALLGVAAHPEEILAITFTRKAAAEMRKRVLEKLAERRGSPLAAAEIAHRLRIETIDAFCMSLARQLPVLAKFGAPPAIAEDARDLYREAAARTIALLEQESFSAKVGRLLNHLDNNVATATALLANMLARRDQWLRKTGRAPTRKELEAAFAAERNRLLQRAMKLDSRSSEAFAREVLTVKGDWRKKPKPAPADIVGNEPLRQALAALLALPPERYTDAQWAALEAMLALLPVAAAELKLVFAARGEADFTEIAQGAVRALGTPEEPTDLLLALDHRIRHVLVDEFQDTSISQWELLERLTAGWQPEDGRTLFVVGDPMQSIYRFREAEVGLFLHARREGLGSAGLPNVTLEPLTLSTNFRSQAGLVSWVNETFEKVLPREEDETSGAVPYSPATAHPDNPALAGAAATWHAPADHEAEAKKIVELVRAAGGDCAILVRNRNSLACIVPALKDAGIRFRAIEIEKLGEKQVVQDLFALTRALTHLADRVAWLAILRAPWVGFTLEEFSSVIENSVVPASSSVVPAQAGTHTIWESIQSVPRLERFRAVLAPALAGRLRGTLRDRVEGVWLALGGPACVQDPTDLEDAEVFLDALENLEEAGEVDFARLAESLQELYALPDLAAGEHDLQIMTIHKAKGLEFGTVIVPGLERAPGRGEPPLLLWKELSMSSSPQPSSSSPLTPSSSPLAPSSSPRTRGPSLLLAPIKQTGAGDEPAYEYLKALDREAEDTEAARLLYVAATRAKHRLHLLACPKKSMPPRRSLLACAWPAAKDAYEGLAPPEGDASAPAPTYTPSVLKCLPAAWTPPAPPPAAAWTPPPEGRGQEEQLPFDWAQEPARLAGVVVHGWFQRIAEDELRGWDAARVDRLKPRLVRELEWRGMPPAGMDRATGIVVAALKNALADEHGRWLLGPHPRAQSEYRITTASGRRMRIDRYIEDAKGVRWVVDFKTGEHRGADAEAFLDEQQKRYARQLDAYAQAKDGARRGLYFPLLRGWREW